MHLFAELPADFFAVNSFVWPLTFVVLGLFVLKRVRDDLRPVVLGMTTALASQSSRYAIAWTFALLTATLATLQSLQEVCQQMHWVLLGAFAKILQPGLAVLVAYGRPQTSSAQPPPAPTPTKTTPPFAAP